MKTNKTKIPILSFYTGGGFLDMGFEMAGYDIVWSNENDEVFAKLHAAGITSWREAFGNFTKAEIFNTTSITELSPTEIINEAFSKGKPDVFGIIGGPPCQDFSINGLLKGFDGERGKLTSRFLDMILKIQPTFFVMENVAGLVRIKNNNDYLQELLDKIKDQYFVDSNILNALNYGVPQYRERVFFVGIRKTKFDIEKLSFKNIPFDSSFGDEFSFPWPINKKYNGSYKKYKWPKANPFGEKQKKPYSIPKELCVKSCLVTKGKQSKIPNADEYFRLLTDKTKLANIFEGETSRQSFKRLHRFRYSPTTCYGNNEVHLHPTENRRISVREALRIQGVPDEYVLPKDLSMAKKFKMIGNGVPVPLASHLAESILKFLKEQNVVM